MRFGQTFKTQYIVSSIAFIIHFNSFGNTPKFAAQYNLKPFCIHKQKSLLIFCVAVQRKNFLELK